MRALNRKPVNMASYSLSPAAERDLYRIWLYGLENWTVEQADRYYNAFFERFEELAQNPLQHPSANDIRHGYRLSVCGVDTIYYRIAGSGIEIMAILGRQDVDEWL